VLVSKANVGAARTVYQWLRDQGIAYQQYIPCVEYDRAGNALPFTITGEDWGAFLVELFDAWTGDRGTISIRHLDELAAFASNGKPVSCATGRNCSTYFVVEYNGDLYPCDFFVRRDLLLGNAAATGLERAFASPAAVRFGRMKTRWNRACDDCRFLRFCSGDCLKHRLLGPSPVPHARSVLCEGLKAFYSHALPRLGI
jgi:uncharacterized protein